MITFTLFRFPVTLQPSFWIVSLLMGWGLASGDEGHPMRLALWVAISFLSILWHELGHAIAFRKFGIESEIVLYSMGGYAAPLSRGTLTRWQDGLVSVAGPFFQLLIGLPLWWMSRSGMFWEFTRQRPFAWDVISMLMWINLIWALVNLLPVLPLDGGRIFRALCGPRRERIALWTSLLCAAAVSLWMLSAGMSFSGLFFGMLAWNNWQRLQGSDEIRW